ncbi:MAG: penicillin-binding protein 2 [Myxococcaceae bacterium]|nr:penicillin-binding protein 2 [Myxococcaceae bacterium]
MELGRQSDGRDLKVRLFVLGAAFVLGLVVLAVNLYRLQVVRYEELLALSTDNQFKDVRVRAPRGQIRDARGEVLVDSRPSFDVAITPAFCQQCATAVIPELASYLGWDETTLQRVTGQVKAAHGPQRYQPMVVQVDLTRDELDLVNAHLHELSGVDVEPVPHRHYRAGEALAHVLGYMNEVTQEELNRLNSNHEGERPPYALGDYIGRRGVERTLESTLRGTDGWRKEVVNARGEVMRDELGRVLHGDEVAPSAGNSVVLSIDARLQAEAERAFPGQAGSIVVLEAKTGFVRALVSRPSFDPNLLTGRVSSSQLAALTKDPLQPMVFRGAAEHYHPGSTFKPVSLLAALRSGAFTPQTTVVCPGGYRLGARTWRCHKESGHGPVQARQALQVSCDTYFYRVADTLGIDPIAQMGHLLGLGQVTGLSVAAEVPGVMPDSAYHDKLTPGGYTKGMALNTAIGQGDVNVTPLQLAVLYAAIGNGGKVFRPQVVRRIESPEGRVIDHFEPQLVRDIELTDEERHVLVDALTAVVNEPGGTAFRSRLADVTVAGKTGTAQVARLGAVRLKKDQMDYFERDHAWFAAFAPAEDPELAIVVLNEHGGHGGSDAAPAAAAVFKRYFELRHADGEAFGRSWSPPLPQKPKPPPPAVAPATVPPPAEGAHQLATVPAPDAGLPLAGEPLPAAEVHP